MEICLLGLLIWCFHLKLLQAAEIFQHQQSAPPKTRTPKMKEWMPSSSSFLVSAFTWVPTPNLDKADPEGSEAAMAFLYSGDVLSLLQANCTQRFEVRALGKDSGPPPALHSYLRSATDTLTHATNFLNMVFQTNDIRESSVKEDVEWYHALVRSVMEGDSQVYRAILTFDAHPLSSKPQMILQATKGNNEILLQDLSAFSENLRNLTWENEWYNFFRFQRTSLLHKRILSNDLKTLDTPKWSQGDSYVMDQGYVKWSPPFLECEDGKFLPTWMVTLSSSFYGLKPDLNPEFKGVMRLDVKIQNVDINQCATSGGWFGNTHQCDLNSTQCVPQESHGFVLGKYHCLCKPGFYGGQRTATSSSHPSSTSNGWSGQSASQYGAVDSGNLLQCHPCQEGCTACIDSTPCLIQEDWSLRAVVLAFQAFCMLTVFFSMLISYHYRKSKRIRASGVILLETILFGSLLLYFPVFILYFKPSIFRCIVLRWVRMLGFAIVYGTITLKLYRVLKVFLSHTAQRVPYMTSGRVLKKLALILLLVLWFLAAWTVGMLENREKNIPLVVRSQTPRGLQFYICDQDRWDYMMAVAEMLFLFWGSFLCYATRTVPSAFHEPRYLCIALHNELITSTAFHVIRFLMVPSLHPDWTLLLFFIHTHVTTTMTLALIFIPKFLHAGSPLREEIAAEVYEDELDMRRSGSFLNSSITSAWSEHSLDPDDIRDELKKLYTQLEVHKTKKMTANNPHLQKKRSSKRGLGHTLMKRITEFPESMSRQCSKEEKDGSISGRRQSHSGSYKQRCSGSGNLSMKLKEDFSSKHKVAFQAQGRISLKKSHSTYDHRRDVKGNSVLTRHDSCKEASLLDSLMRKKLAKKASEKSDNDSATLVYKSASAHNLLADKKSLHPKLSALQKSLCVASSAKENASLLTSTANFENTHKLAQKKDTKTAVEDTMTGSKVSRHTEFSDVASEIVVKQLQIKNPAKEIERHLPEGGRSSKDIMCLWEAVTAPSTPLEGRAERHVTSAPIRSVSINISDLPGRRHHAIKRAPPPPARQQSLIHNLEGKYIAPSDTYDKKQHPAQSPQKEPPNIPVLVNICPKETEGYSPLKPEMEKTMHGEDNVPPSSLAGLTRLASIAAEVCPWEVMEMPIPSKKDLEVSDSDNQNSSLEKQSQSLISKSSIKSLGMAIKAFNRSKIKRNISSGKNSEGSETKNEKDISGKPKLAETALMSIEGSSRQEVLSRSSGFSRAKPISKQAAICPWDEEEETCPSSQKNNLNRALELCPWEMNQDVQDRVSNLAATASKSAEEISPIRLEKTKNQWVSLCPSEAIEDQNRENKTSNILLMVSKTDKKADTCPWEIANAISSNKSDTKSWKISGALPQDETMNKDKKKPSDEYRKEMPSRHLSPETLEKVCGQHDSRDTKEPFLGAESTKSLDLSKVDQKKSRCIGSSEIEVSPSKTEPAEEFPCEVASCPLENVKIGPSKDFIWKASNPLKIPEDNIWHDSICPLKGTELEDALQKTSAKCLDLSNTYSEMSDSFQSKMAGMAPWETQAPNLKTVVSPWENKAASTSETELRENLSAVSREEKKGTREVAFGKGNNQNRESICPWESIVSEDLLIKPTSKNLCLSKFRSENSESLKDRKTTVCPWEAEGTEIAIKEEEICPWETSVPSTKIASNQDTEGATKRTVAIVSKPPDKARSSQETSSPWEVLNIDELPSKSNVKSLNSPKSGSTESFLAEVCPWETRDSPKTILQNETGPSKITEKVNNLQEFVCPWDIVDPSIISKIPSNNFDSTESLKAEVCPWEVTKDNASEVDDGCKSTSPVSLSQAIEKLSSLQEDLCPWDNMGLQQLSARSGDQSPALWKTDSKKSDSIKSLRTEVCPWETSEEVKICPWTEAMASLKTRKLKQVPVVLCKEKEGNAQKSPNSKKVWGEIALKKIKKSKSHQGSIFPLVSMGTDKPLAKSTQSLDLLQVSSKKTGSVESLKAEICPWEFQELQTDAKTEIGPGTIVEGPPDESTFREESDQVSNDKADTKPLIRQMRRQEEVSSPQESICSWESLEQASSQSPVLPKDGSKKSENAESPRAEVCPWEAEEEESSGKAELCLMETAPTSSNDGILRQDINGVAKGKTLTSPSLKKVWIEIAAKKFKSHSQQASISSQENTDILAVKPRSKSLDLSIKLDNAESLKTEFCPWEMQEAGATMKAEICPWGGIEAPPEKGTSSSVIGWASKGNVKTGSRSPIKTPDTLEKTSHSQQSNFQQENTDAAEVMVTTTSPKKFDGTENIKTEVSPQEASQSGASNEGEICPWEAGTEVSTNTGKRAQSKQQSLAGHKPLCRSLPRALPEGINRILSLESREDIFIDNIFVWEAEEDSMLTRKDSAKISENVSEACLGEPEEASSMPAVVAQSKTEQKPEAQEAEDSSKVTSGICPWDCD
ncbi:probable G-protein coupled receptor 179 [Candoia aspera]|uniref:probable G-protein coupled receptor 179 n=1 Tax=Candoia aspera TaxID=51853 RepID=UPI002FD7DBA5